MSAKERLLIVGATGQLGTAVTRRLSSLGIPVTALVRSDAGRQKFAASGVPTVTGDLLDDDSLRRACDSVGVIVATATATVPTRQTDTAQSVDGEGYQNLIRAASRAGVRRFVFTSVPSLKAANLPRLFRFKRETEAALAASGMEVVVLRADAFMDVQFAMMGSAIPLRGADSATVLRSCPFVKKRFESIRDSIEKTSVAHVSGDPKARHAFVALDDVAACCAAAATCSVTGTFSVTGPEALSLLDVVRLYERLLNRKLSMRHTPLSVVRLAAWMLRFVSPAGSELMQLTLTMAEETFPDSAAQGVFGIKTRSAETFLHEKIAIPANNEG